MNLFICYSKCSTCQKARKFLENHQIMFKERDIKNDNPTSEELKEWIEKSNLPVQKFFNTSGLIYKEWHLKEKLPNMTDEEKIDMLSSNGMLVKRPILVTENKVFVGFKEREYEELL